MSNKVKVVKVDREIILEDPLATASVGGLVGNRAACILSLLLFPKITIKVRKKARINEVEHSFQNQSSNLSIFPLTLSPVAFFRKILPYFITLLECSVGA